MALAPATRRSADTNQMEMALLNLAINARDAMPAGGTITIGTEPGVARDRELQDGACLKIRVKITASA